MALEVRYLVDERGRRVGGVLDLKKCERMLQELEELESIRAYDAAKAWGDEAIPLDQAVAEIEPGQNGQMKYSVPILRRAQKELAGLSLTVYPRVLDAIRNLAHDPRPPGVRKLRDTAVGHEPFA